MTPLKFNDSLVLYFSLLLFLILPACLQTRADLKELEEKRALQQTVNSLQHSEAGHQASLAETQNALRELNGRIEVLEARSRQIMDEKQALGVEGQARTLETNEKIRLLQEGLVRLEETLEELKAQASSSQKASSASKGPFVEAEELFNKKEWKKAVLSYQKYRDKYPKGANVPEATYKIGVCFQEMKMNDEAKAFFREVMDRFPKSKIANKAKFRLKDL